MGSTVRMQVLVHDNELLSALQIATALHQLGLVQTPTQSAGQFAGVWETLVPSFFVTF